jgi:hypothetical protein
VRIGETTIRQGKHTQHDQYDAQGFHFVPFSVPQVRWAGAEQGCLKCLLMNQISEERGRSSAQNQG